MNTRNHVLATAALALVTALAVGSGSAAVPTEPPEVVAAPAPSAVAVAPEPAVVVAAPDVPRR